MINKLSLVTIFCIITLLFSGCTLVDKERAGLQIKSDTTATVYLNNENKGSTPLTLENLAPGEYEIKLENDQGSWTKSVRIENGTLFYINYNLAPTEDLQEGEMIYLETGRGVGVISTPGNAEVTLDGEKQGFTPYLIQNLSDGEHELVLAKDGFKSRAIKLSAVKDHKIMVEAKLKSLTATSTETTPTPSPSSLASASPAPSGKATSTPKASATPKTSASSSVSASPSSSGSTKASATPQATKAAGSSTNKGTITVLETSTGWLRVRDKAGLEGKEIGKLDTGDTVDYVDQTDNGWTEVIMEDGQHGFVASRFVKVN